MISVCIATYNGEQNIKQQLESILVQLDDEDEVVVSDDGSSDETLNIISRFADSRIRIFYHNKKNVSSRSAGHIYTAANFGNALRQVRGDYVFLADQDDIWVSGRVEKMKNALADHLLVYCNFSVIDSKGDIIQENYFKVNPVSCSLFKNILRMPFYGCCMAFRKELLNSVLPFPSKLLLHDNWIGMIALKRGKVFYIEEVLHLYRKHSNNVSGATGKSKNSLFYRLWYRAIFYFQIRKYLK